MNVKFLVFTLIAIAGLLYLYGVGMAIYISYQNVCPDDPGCALSLKPTLVFIVTSIGGVLATNFGAIVGLPS
ncbi:MAG: hypothetical protein RLO12_06215, partial [Fulvivirga sp.]